jgi:hypothetical protein
LRARQASIDTAPKAAPKIFIQSRRECIILGRRH